MEDNLKKQDESIEETLEDKLKKQDNQDDVYLPRRHKGMYIEDFYKNAKQSLMSPKLLKHLKSVKKKVYTNKRIRITESVHGKAYTISDLEQLAVETGLDIVVNRTIPLTSILNTNAQFIGFIYDVLYKDKEKCDSAYTGYQAFPLLPQNKNAAYTYAGSITYWRRQILLILLGFGNDDYDPEFDKEEIKKVESNKQKAQNQEKINEVKKEFAKIEKEDPNYLSKLPATFSGTSNNLQEWKDALTHYKKQGGK